MRNAYSSSQRHKRHIPSKVCKAGASSGGADVMRPPPSFTRVLTSQSQAYTNGRPCYLILPKQFCDEHKVARHVTMTDSTGHRLWHMLCNNKKAGTDGQLYYVISDGWREFAFDHSLKLNGKLVFTLVSPSHFVVEFASHRMRRTLDGKNYPWKLQSNSMSMLNHPKKDFRGTADTIRSSGSANKSNSSCFTIALVSKYQIHTTGSRRQCTLALPRLFCDEHNVSNHVTMMDSTGHTLWHMRCSQSSRILGYYRIHNGWREFAYDHSLKLNDKLAFTLVSPSHFLVEFATSKGLTCPLRPTRDGMDYPWPRHIRHGWRNYSEKAEGVCKVQTPMRYEACALEIKNSKSNAKESVKMPELKELIYMECKNPDGTTFLQILDSDSECDDELEEGSP